MITIGDIDNEIDRIIVERIDQGLSTPTPWIVSLFMKRHSDVYGKDADWHLCCTKTVVPERVRVCLRRRNNPFAVPAEDPMIVTLTGFEYIQSAYMIEQGGMSITVPIEKMTYEERKAKVAELRRMGDGCYRHADELERYNEAMRQNDTGTA